MEEPTPICSLCSFFTNKYNRLQNQDNLPSSSGLQLSPRFQAKIGLFISFLALAASFEVLLASSMGKSAFPNDSAVSDFLTRPLSKSHQHFTNGTVLGVVGFVLSLGVLIYFVNRLCSTSQVPEKKYSCGFIANDYPFSGFGGGDGYRTGNYYRSHGIDPQKETLAVVVQRDYAPPIYVGIPYSKYQENAWPGHVFKEEIENLRESGVISKKTHYDRLIVTPIEKCVNLQRNNFRASQTNNVT